MLYARWLGRGFIEPYEALTQKAPFLSFFHKVDIGECLNWNDKQN